MYIFISWAALHGALLSSGDHAAESMYERALLPQFRIDKCSKHAWAARRTSVSAPGDSSLPRIIL